MAAQNKSFNNSTIAINDFKGISFKPVLNSGELLWCNNLNVESPALVTRKPLKNVFTWSDDYCNGIIDVDGVLYWLSKGYMYHYPDNDPTQTVVKVLVSTDYTGTQYKGFVHSLVKFGAYIIVFPEKKAYKVSNDTVENLVVPITLVAEEAVESYEDLPLTGNSNGDLRLVTDESKSYYWDINRYEWIYTTKTAGQQTEPNYDNLDFGAVPDIEYCCVHNNRVWGIGETTAGTPCVYSSARGNCFGATGEECGWTSFYLDGDEDTTNDDGAYFLEVPEGGEFTGITSWDGRVVLFKENSHYEINGDYPSNYGFQTISKVGCSYNRAIHEIGSKLYWLNKNGLYQYAGGLDVCVSDELNGCNIFGTDHKVNFLDYTYAAADNNKYYIIEGWSGTAPSSSYIYCYNPSDGYWTSMSLPAATLSYSGYFGISAMTDYNGERVMAVQMPGAIILPYSDYTWDSVDWSIEFDDYLDDFFGKKTIQELSIRMVGTQGNTFKVETWDATTGDMVTVKEGIFDTSILSSYRIPLNRNDANRFRISGTGKAVIYGYQFRIQKVGDGSV